MLCEDQTSGRYEADRDPFIALKSMQFYATFHNRYSTNNRFYTLARMYFDAVRKPISEFPSIFIPPHMVVFYITHR